MAESKHLLYLLSDVAYAVELMPDGTGYVIRDYLQINGNFMDDNLILEESLEKLVAKIQPQAYDLVLPDFLFTNTVVSVDKTGEEEVKKHVLETIVPTLEIKPEEYSIQAFMLAELKGVAKAQLSALELSVLDPLRKTFGKDGGPSIHNVYPLSWTLKSLISLEPSISVVQMGGQLYLAQHYIGVDQANNSTVEDVSKLVETVKTLKGAEPSIQTLYLLSSPLIEEKLQQGLKDTLPLQQVADNSEESEMPAYVKKVLESGAKTMATADYKLPVFTMGTAPTKETMPKADQTDLPTPTEVGEEVEETELKFADVPEKEPATPAEETKPEEETPAEEPAAKEDEAEDVDLSQFSDQTEATDKPAEKPAKEPEPKEAVAKKEEPMLTAEVKPAKKVIKNETGVNNMVRMIFIGLVSFFVTVGVGLGIGLGLLTFTNSQEEPVEETTTMEETAVTEEVTPTPTPAVELDRTEYTVLVVNATTTAGYAGDIADKLETAGFESIDAANAKGDYETGNYVLMAEDNQALVDLIAKDTGLDMAYAEDKAVEDSADEYTIVVVLAE